ncbi:OmpA family protein [Marinobacter salinisoli]|uniref:OmpA family protein n=1 Tax=Marinobacter salinisoli TaxID=2769486 RepID=A0ABX7MSG0_9GAMM|nr:OmpA family protein [Marinobacter salinisoli]QSP95089.1 OmpA family protein [Marinobacter salinisoli]
MSIAIPETSSRYQPYSLHVLEQRALDNKVSVLSSKELKQRLDLTGRAIVGGIIFEHDSASILENSKPALGQVAALLSSTTDLKLYVVGHTDNTGDLEYNRRLSESRARSVVDHLVTFHGIARDRLQGFGIASLSPEGSNTSAEGRAQNRRAELVVQ